MTNRIDIETTLPLVYRDRGPWRSYELSTTGNHVGELLCHATVVEMDEDGGEIRTYGLEEAPSEVYSAAQKVILEVYKKAMEKTA